MNKKQDYINYGELTLLDSISNFKKDLSKKTIKNYIKNKMVKVNDNVINNSSMFHGCGKLREIRMVGCTPETRTKIEETLTTAGITDDVTIVTE